MPRAELLLAPLERAPELVDGARPQLLKAERDPRPRVTLSTHTTVRTQPPRGPLCSRDPPAHRQDTQHTFNHRHQAAPEKHARVLLNLKLRVRALLNSLSVSRQTF